MDVPKYTENLNNLLSKDVINNSDVIHYVKYLVRLSNEVKVEVERFKTFAPVVNQWIRAFKPIFRDKNIDDSVKMSIRKSGKILTYVFLSLMQSFAKYQQTHSLEFYGLWKQILSAINPQKLAEYVCLYGQQFKSLIENLRTATNRCDQLSILAVLLMYIEHLSSDRLKELKEKSNNYILDKLAVLNKTPNLIMNQHSFLHDIDAMSERCIISLKPTKIICDEISLNLNTSAHVMWIDFNMRENSITLVAVSPTQNAITLLATVLRPKLKEKLADEHELKIRGTWTVINGPHDAFVKRAAMNVYLHIHDRNAIWKIQVKSVFRFELDELHSQSITSQESMAIELRLPQFALHVLRDQQRLEMSHLDESFASFSMAGSQFQPKSITPIARTQFDVDEISLFGVNQAMVPNDCIENSSVVGESKIEHVRLADLPVEEDLFSGLINDPIRDSPNGSIGDPLHDLLDGAQNEVVDDHHSDFSSGISIGNDMSVLDDDQSRNGIDGQLEIGINGQLEIGNLKSFRACSIGSFSSIDSSLSQIGKQVERFIEGTQTRPEQQSSQPRKPLTDGNISIARKVTDSIRDITEPTSSAPIDEPNEGQTKFASPNDRPLENSNKSQPIRSASVMSHTENAKKHVAVELQNESIQKSLSNHNSLKAHPSSEKLRNEKIDKQLRDDFIMADYHDAQDDNRSDASASLQSNLSMVSNEDELTFDDEGMVLDKRGCVFDNNDELEDAWYVYIENDGMAYLKSEAFKSSRAEQRQRTEREFRAIHNMINRKFENDTYTPNKPITGNGRCRTAKRKLWNSLDDGSTCSSEEDIYQEPKEKKSKSSLVCYVPSKGDIYQQPKEKKSKSSLMGDAANTNFTDAVPAAEQEVDNGKLQGVSCAMTQFNDALGYLKDFFETRKTCELHRVKLLHLITEMQANNIKALSGKEPYSTKVANIRTMCQQAREYASMILHDTYKQ